jgi:hypothetical protein
VQKQVTSDGWITAIGQSLALLALDAPAGIAWINTLDFPNLTASPRFRVSGPRATD